jgi:Ca2+/H+ antiporter, TMEM165/GDT1 family
LRGDDADVEEDEAAAAGRGRPLAGATLVMTVAGTFVVAEFGDKTMLATFALAASYGAVPVWIGATLGEIGANLVAIIVGRRVGHLLSPRVVRIGSAVLFAVAGVLVLVEALA